MKKIEATKYLTLKLSDWYFDEYPDKKADFKNDLSILKILKLIFLLSPLEFEGSNLLDKGFKFEAWALGPVEVDIYNEKQNLSIDLAGKKVRYHDLSNSVEQITDTDLTIEDKRFLDGIVNLLKNKNRKLIKYTASQLVDLTHKYISWIDSYLMGSEMENSEIISEEKYYFL